MRRRARSCSRWMAGDEPAGGPDARRRARFPGKGCHPAKRARDSLLRVAGPPAQPGAAASLVRLRADVAGDGRCPRLALPRLRPRPAGPRRQRPARRRLLGGGVRPGPGAVLPGGGPGPRHRRRPVARWPGRAGVRGNAPAARAGPGARRRAASQQLLPDPRGDRQGARRGAADARVADGVPIASGRARIPAREPAPRRGGGTAASAGAQPGLHRLRAWP